MCLERYLIEQCAPTLASLKTGSLFGVIEPDEAELRRQAALWQSELATKGLVLSILRYRNGRALIYLGRLSQLSRDLSAPGAEQLLARCGYIGSEPGAALRRLSERIHTAESFPHEIGLFLGYPLEDVLGFIQYGGKRSTGNGGQLPQQKNSGEMTEEHTPTQESHPVKEKQFLAMAQAAAERNAAENDPEEFRQKQRTEKELPADAGV